MADLFVCSSRHEPLGNVILEAWANRTPVVSTMAEGPVEFISKGEDALLSPLSNPEALAATILEMLNANETDRNRMIEAGFKNCKPVLANRLLFQLIFNFISSSNNEF